MVLPEVVLAGEGNDATYELVMKLFPVRALDVAAHPRRPRLDGQRPRSHSGVFTPGHLAWTSSCGAGH